MKHKHRIISCTLAFLALELALISWIDLPLSNLMRQLDTDHHGMVEFFRAITDAGKSIWYLWPTGIGTLICLAGVRLAIVKPALKRKLAMAGPKLLFVFLAVALSGIVTDILKPLIGRARPVEFTRDGIYGFQPWSFHAAMNSLPSGHAITAATLAAALAATLNMGCFTWNILAFVLIISRVIVNAHYLADVLAGTMIGWLTVAGLRQQLFPVGKNARLQGLFPIDRLPGGP